MTALNDSVKDRRRISTRTLEPLALQGNLAAAMMQTRPIPSVSTKILLNDKLMM